MLTAVPVDQDLGFTVRKVFLGCMKGGSVDAIQFRDQSYNSVEIGWREASRLQNSSSGIMLVFNSVCFHQDLVRSQATIH